MRNFRKLEIWRKGIQISNIAESVSYEKINYIDASLSSRIIKDLHLIQKQIGALITVLKNAR